MCLLAVAYKLFASVLLRRLLAAGAEERLCPSQFAFRRGRSTEDALHCARRAVELAWSQQGGSVHLLALDWAKAFDSINPEAMMGSLRKFGIPDPVIDMVLSIYTDRIFRVRESGALSFQNILNNLGYAKVVHCHRFCSSSS